MGTQLGGVSDLREVLVELAREAARRHGLPEEIVCAICERESEWSPWAIRDEEGFYRKYVEPRHVGITEARAEAFSWGLMQVMGLTAREHGYKAPLPKLCDPEIGIEIGCQVFAAKLASEGGDISRGLLAYNGGDNKNYPAEVLARAPKYLPKEAA